MPILLSDSTAPRTRLNLTELMDRVRGDLGMRDSSLLTDQDLINWFNEAQDVMAREARWYRISTTIDSVANTKEYSLPIPSAGRCISIEEVYWLNRPLGPINPEELLLASPYYLTVGVGTPYVYYPRGSTGFGLHYTPNVSTVGAIRVVFVGRPPRVEAPLEAFYAPHGVEDGFVIYAKKLASEKDAYGEGKLRVDQYRQEWAQYLRELKQQVDSVSEREIMIIGEDAMLRQHRPVYTVPYTGVDPA